MTKTSSCAEGARQRGKVRMTHAPPRRRACSTTARKPRLRTPAASAPPCGRGASQKAALVSSSSTRRLSSAARKRAARREAARTRQRRRGKVNVHPARQAHRRAAPPLLAERERLSGRSLYCFCGGGCGAPTGLLTSSSSHTSSKAAPAAALLRQRARPRVADNSPPRRAAPRARAVEKVRVRQLVRGRVAAAVLAARLERVVGIEHHAKCGQVVKLNQPALARRLHGAARASGGSRVLTRQRVATGVGEAHSL